MSSRPLTDNKSTLRTGKKQTTDNTYDKESLDMEKIEKSKALAAVVHTFFKYFILGVIEGKAGDNAPADMNLYEPHNVKQTATEYIEDVSRLFNQEAFYAISRMNYVEEELERELKQFIVSGNTADAMGLMRFACRTEDFYCAMVNEYKRNMESLLCGSLSPVANGDDITPMTETLGVMETRAAEDIINRIANCAYEEGRKLAG